VRLRRTFVAVYAAAMLGIVYGAVGGFPFALVTAAGIYGLAWWAR